MLNNYLAVPLGNFTPGQKVTLKVTGVAISETEINVDGIDVDKKSKMNVTETLLRRLDARTQRMEKNMPRTEHTG